MDFGTLKTSDVVLCKLSTMRNGKAVGQNFPKNLHYFSPQVLTKSRQKLCFDNANIFYYTE